MTIERSCIGCGCSDSIACIGGCSWAFESDLPALGICTQCVDEFDDPETVLVEASSDWLRDNEDPEIDDDPGLILPGDPQFYPTLRGMRS